MKIRVPATSANLGPGFDTLGMAFNLYNTVEMEFRPSGLQIEVEGLGSDAIPTDESNIIYQSAKQVFEYAGKSVPGLYMKLVNEIPLSRGLGSSAAAIVGGIVAANRLCNDALDVSTLLQIATDIEGHPDNVAPALLGGFTIAGMEQGKVRYVRLDPLSGLKAVVAVPAFTLSTHKSRGVLPRTVALEDAVFNVSRTAFLVAALCLGHTDLLNMAMEDRLHQPYRCTLVPGMEDVWKAAREAGALSAALSGAGPCLIAFATTRTTEIGKAMQDAFALHGIECDIVILSPDRAGAIAV
jgi:homoserine kinase